MESINHTLFLWLNAPEHPSALALTLATFFAEQLIWAVPLLIGIGWLRGSEGNRKAMLVVTASGLLGLLINQAIGLAWVHPPTFHDRSGAYPYPSCCRFLFPKRSPDAVVGRCVQPPVTATTSECRHQPGLVGRSDRLGSHLPWCAFPI